MKKLIDTWKQCSTPTKVVFVIISPIVLFYYLIGQFAESIEEFRRNFDKN